MGLGANAEPVPFDFGAASALIEACQSAATSVDGQVGQRWSLVTKGSEEFAGLFSRLFAQNALTAAADATELSTALREMADKAQQLADQAREEQRRRDRAKAWQEEHDHRSVAEQFGDWLTGGDDPPFSDPVEPPPLAVPTPPSTPRQPLTPAGGSGEGGGGTSSAKPDNLHAYASGSADLNDQLQAVPGRVGDAYSTFCMTCHWGSLDAYGPINGFRQWLAANADDVQWARLVADAFKVAGGEGKVSTLANSAIAATLQAHHVNLTRNDLTIEPPQAYGAPPTSGYADDPVNTATGNFLEVEADIAFPGAAGSLTLGRCYNSFDSTEDGGEHAFGPGWSSVCEAGLTLDGTGPSGGLDRFTLPDGRQVRFPRLGEGWDRALGESLWLHEDRGSTDGSNDLLVTGNDGSWWRLTSGGSLLSYGTGPESSRSFITLQRDEAGRVIRLEHARGQWIALEWSDDHVAVARTADGCVVTYAYDADGHLVAATGPGGTRSYRWNEDGLIAAVVDADGVVEVENVYDAEGRVTTQRSPFGRMTRYVYLPGRTTVVSDEDGTRSNTWLHDDRGRLIGVVDADEQRQSTSYDRWGNRVLLTERDGATTIHEYDARGRRTRTVTPSGADVAYGYDDLDRVTTVVTEQGAVTEYTYEGEQRNPSTILDPEGGLSRLAWADGLLVELVDPTDVVVRFSYDAHGDLVGTTDAEGRTAGLERDTLGRVTAAVTPSGLRTEFVWDAVSGTLAERRDADGGTWRFEYTAAGRLIATVDPLGARTTVEHGAHGEEAATVDPLGRAINRRYDDLGNVSSVELPDGSHWRFAHDALSRLTSTTGPDGGTWSQTFDAAGHLVARTDPTGVRVGLDADPRSNSVRVQGVDPTSSTTTGFDPLGRLTSVTGIDGAAEVFTYDRCGRAVEALDGDGGLTVIARDAAGRVVAITSPSGARTQYAYDRCGRLRTVTDPAGGTVTVGYDADGFAVEQTLATGEVARSAFDPCGRLVRHAAPGTGTSTWAYDLAGHVVAWSDPQDGSRTFRYDAAGQLVAATDGNGGVTTYRSDALGRTTEIVDPLGGTTRREFDGLNHCVAETDPLGRTTRAGYDGAGRLAWQESPDGRRTTWTYDAAGRPAAMAVDGRTVTALTRDLRRRTVRITDTSDPAGAVSEHELCWNTRGQLVRRARDGKAVTWTYDVDGRRTSMTTPDGSTTRYGWDAGGRLAWLDHSTLGRAAFDRDAAGRIVSAVAGGLIQSFEHRDGFVVAHSITDGEGATRTEIERDEQGRVRRVTKGGGTGSTTDRSVTDHDYDGAGQLVWSRTRAGIGTATGRWAYDAAGRLLSETIENDVTSSVRGDRGPDVTRHVYDAAGQLLSTLDAEGVRTSYSYDAAGRRLRVEQSDGHARDYVWNPTGYLAGIVRHDRDRVRKITIRADALGELASVDGTEFFWDSAAYAGAPVLAGDTPVLSAGPVTGIGAGWTAPGWRTARSNGPDPWSAHQATQVLGGLGAAAIGTSGEVSVDGLEWMGSRVYDPSSRGFLSVDPLDPVVGAAWSGNPYAFAGNDPLQSLDPTGLRPVTDAELAAYRSSNGIGGTLQAAGNALSSAMDATGHWFKNNWEYVAGGAMVVAGGALMVTGVGGPAGAMLLSAGADTIIQKATTGHVNWGEVAVSGASGAVGFGVGGALAKTGMSVGAREVTANVAEGVVGNGAGYLTGPGPHTPAGLLRSSTVGAVTSVGPVHGGAAAHDLGAGANRLLSRTENCIDGCFVEGTLVLMADGTAKAVDQVEPGDEVLAFDPETGRNSSRRVVDAFVHHDVPTFDVLVGADAGDVADGGDGGDGGEGPGAADARSAQRVTTTAEHPFMVVGQGWTPVRELRKGDELVRPDGSTARVFSVDATGDTATVYNVEVDGLHSYYVQVGTEWLLVHNGDCGNLRTIASDIRESGLHPATRNQRVIAVGEDAQGTLHAGSSNGFDAGQRAALERHAVNRVPGSGSLHAEEELMRGVPDLRRVGTSRRMPCGPTEHDCAAQLAARGIEVDQ